jgi:hypothetical protein
LSIKSLIANIDAQVTAHNTAKVYGEPVLYGFGLATDAAPPPPTKEYSHFLRGFVCESEEDGAPKMLAQIQSDIAATKAKEIFWRKHPFMRIAGPLDIQHDPSFIEGSTLIVARYSLA